MTLEQLKIFLAVAKYMHFTRASEELYITQPAVSASIQSLENEYKVKLFQRIGRHIEITDAGKLLLVEAQKILEQVAVTERLLKELNNLQRGELKLGASLTVANYWLPQKISQFKLKYPHISVNCTLANAREIVEGTAKGKFDLGLVTGEINAHWKGCLEKVAVGTDRLLIVVGRSHLWFDRDLIMINELTKANWILREPGSGAQQMFEDALKNWGVDPSQLKATLVLNSSEMVKAVVETGVGVAAIPELMVQKELQLGTLHALPVMKSEPQEEILEMVQPVWLLKHRDRFQTKLAIAFEKMLHH